MTRAVLALCGAACLLAGCTGGTPATGSVGGGGATASSAPAAPAGPVPRPDHVVVVVEENHSYADIIGNPAARYVNGLANSAALYTASFAVAHPSEPNYLALFSGSTQGLGDDSCPHTFGTGNLGAQLAARRLSFAGYSEDLPSAGYSGCSAGEYARKHSPWVNFPSVPATANLPFSAFPTDYASLPTVSFVIPNLLHDMHDGTIAQADGWLAAHLDGYLHWATTHHSLLVVTWDEDDSSQANQIPTVIAGAGVKPGRYAERIDHYTLLRTLETAYGLPPLGSAAAASPITDCWATPS